VNVRYDVAKNWRILSNISGSAAPIFALFTPYESALRAYEVSMLTHYKDMKGDEKCKNYGVLRG